MLVRHIFNSFIIPGTLHYNYYPRSVTTVLSDLQRVWLFINSNNRCFQEEKIFI